MKKNFTLQKNASELLIDNKIQEETKENYQAESLNIPKGKRIVEEAKSDRLQLLVKPSIKQDLKKLALMSNDSVNNLVNIILEDYLKDKFNEE